MKKLLTLVLALSFTNLLPAQTQLYVTNGKVYTVVATPTAVYIGGSFTQVGPAIPNGVPISTTTSLPNTAYAKPNGLVFASAPDGNGGWYIGGQFTKVGAVARAGLAQIDASGNVTAWNPAPNGAVRALTTFGNTVYVGGGFTTIGGQTRNRIAAINGTTGLANSWNPNAGGLVYSMVVAGTNIYIGGFFTSIGGTTRNRIAGIDTSTGLLTNFNPNASATVYSLAALGGTIYAGGDFNNTIGGGGTAYLAALDSITGTAQPGFANGADGTVNALATDNTTVYAGGGFSNAGGAARSRIAAIDPATGAATSFDPGADQTVNALVLSGGTLYAGGNFRTMAATTRNGLAALNTSTGALLAFDPNISNNVNTLSLAGSTIYAAGDFATVGGIVRNRIAALDPVTGMPIASFNPNADGAVNALMLSPSNNKIYVAGDFTNIAGAAINKLAALNTNDGSPVAGFNAPFAAGDIGPSTFILSPNSPALYIGGFFSNVNAVAGTAGLFAIDTSNGSILPSFLPAPNNGVRTMAIDPSGSPLYVGGNFTSIGGAPRTRLASVLTTNGTATSFNPGANSNVNAIVLSGTTLYAGGNFSTIGSASRNNIASLSTATSIATPGFAPNADGGVSALLLSGTTLYVGGNFFSNIGGAARSNLAALNAVSGTNVAGFNPGANSSIQSIALVSNTLYLGGGFTVIGDRPLQSIAALNASTGTPLPVRLISFDATRTGIHEARITWKIASPSCTDFLTERSEDGSRFVTINKATANDQQDYTTLDPQAPATKSYYRLKMITCSGQETYSQVAAINGMQPGKDIQISPIPATDEVMIVVIDADSPNGEAAVISNAAGRQMCIITLRDKTTLNMHNWPVGLYFLHTAEGRTFRFIKN